jgi:hypothetical protein
MEGPCFQFIPEIAYNREPFSVVQGPVASFATLGDKFDPDASLTSKSSESSNEFVASHGKKYRTYMTEDQAEYVALFRSSLL